MAPLPQNNTARVFLDYTSFQVQHTICLRPNATATVSDMEQLAADFADTMGTRMFDSDSVFAARYSNAGDDFSLPLDFTAVEGAIALSSNFWVEDGEAAFLSLPMRSIVSGRRASFQFYTPVRTTDWPADNRYNPGDAAPIDTLRLNFKSVIDGVSGWGGQLVAIDGTALIVYEYMNIAKNAYWQRKQRVS